MTTLVVCERRSRMTCATVVPRSGTPGQFAARLANDFLREVGADCGDVILKSDGAATIKAVAGGVESVRIREEAPRATGSSRVPCNLSFIRPGSSDVSCKIRGVARLRTSTRYFHRWVLGGVVQSMRRRMTDSLCTSAKDEVLKGICLGERR